MRFQNLLMGSVNKSSKQVHAWIHMLIVAQPYFKSGDLSGDVIAAVPASASETPRSL